HATLDGRPVTVAVDDDSVVQQAARSTGKAARLYQMARQRRNPYIEIAQGDTVPDLGPRPGKTGTDSARTFGAEPAFTAGLCDFLVRLDGTRLSLTRGGTISDPARQGSADNRADNRADGEADA